MDGGDLVNALPLIGTVVYALRVIELSQISVYDVSPSASPFFRFGLFVPIGSRYGFAFV